MWKCSKSDSGIEVNSDGVPIQREKVDSSRKYVAFLVFNAAWGAGFLGNLLKLRCSVSIITEVTQGKYQNVQKCRL